MHVSPRILLVEDDRRTAAIVERYLCGAGYVVSLVHDGNGAMRRFHDEHPDLVILDVMLPGTDGFEICGKIRDESRTPVIMLTARIDERDRLRGLLGGADDYVVKPFSPRELVARVAAVLRRTGEPDRRAPMRTQFGRLELDPLACDARVGNVSLGLTLTEYRLLDALCTTPGSPWTRARLLERVFGWDYEGTERTVDTHIANLRKKLGARGDEVPRIATLFGRGYALVSSAAR